MPMALERDGRTVALGEHDGLIHRDAGERGESPVEIEY